MALTTTLAACNVNPALNGPDGATDLPSTLDDQCRYLASFIAQLRDGVASGGGALWMTGMVANFISTTTPTGWLKLNGQLVSRTTYANLWAYAQATGGVVSEVTWAATSVGCFAVGDGVTTFRLPDLRGLHARGLDEGRNFDPGRVFGQFQDSSVISHTHGINDPGHFHSGATAAAGGHTHSYTDPGHAHIQGASAGAGITYAGPGGSPSPVFGNTGTSPANITINAVGDHAHGFSTNPASIGITATQGAGISETRVRTVAWPFFIKY